MVVGESPEEQKKRSKSSSYSSNYNDSTAPNTSPSTTFAPREMKARCHGQPVADARKQNSRNWSKLRSKSYRPNNIADVRKLIRKVGSDLGTKSSSPKDEVEVVHSIVESKEEEVVLSSTDCRIRSCTGSMDEEVPSRRRLEEGEVEEVQNNRDYK